MATEDSAQSGEAAPNTPASDSRQGEQPRPVVRKASWKLVGPGIVVAATGVGAGDLVATLIAGSKFGYTLMWAAVIGCIVKIALAEATGRWHLATGRTIFDGWRDLGSWTTVYFAIYVVVWGFVYGGTAMSSSGLPLEAMFPGVLNLKAWAIITGLVGLVFVWFNRYAVFEKVMTALIGVMFVVVVYVAVLVSPDVGASFAGLVPVLPDGSVFYTLGLIGGVGGTITMAAYGYWVNAKGWTDSGWMKMRRLRRRDADRGRGTAALLAHRDHGGRPGAFRPRQGAGEPLRRVHRQPLPRRFLRHLLHLADRCLARREPDVRRLRGEAEGGPQGRERRPGRAGGGRWPT
jgi:hypothetical protein